MLISATERPEPAPTASDYERDFYAWAMKNAALLRQRRLAEIDVDNIAEELESMGRSEKRELVNRLAILLTHLLKWRYQPNRRGNGWRYTIREQRRAVFKSLRDNPSLHPQLAEYLSEAYEDALLKALKQTGLEEGAFSATCPFTLEQILDDNFWPE
jgi:hypothetical protein